MTEPTSSEIIGALAKQPEKRSSSFTPNMCRKSEDYDKARTLHRSRTFLLMDGLSAREESSSTSNKDDVQIHQQQTQSQNVVPVFWGAVSMSEQLRNDVPDVQFPSAFGGGGSSSDDDDDDSDIEFASAPPPQLLDAIRADGIRADTSMAAGECASASPTVRDREPQESSSVVDAQEEFRRIEQEARIAAQKKEGRRLRSKKNNALSKRGVPKKSKGSAPRGRPRKKNGQQNQQDPAVVFRNKVIMALDEFLAAVSSR